MLSAVAGGNLAIVCLLLDRHQANLSAVDDNNENALHLAIRLRKSLRLITELIKHGIDIESRGFISHTAILNATERGDFTTANLRLGIHYADLNAVDFNNENPLNLNTETYNSFGYTALLAAAKVGDLVVTRLLLEICVADLYAVDSDNNSACILRLSMGKFRARQRINQSRLKCRNS